MERRNYTLIPRVYMQSSKQALKYNVKNLAWLLSIVLIIYLLSIVLIIYFKDFIISLTLVVVNLSLSIVECFGSGVVNCVSFTYKFAFFVAVYSLVIVSGWVGVRVCGFFTRFLQGFLQGF